MDGPFGLDVQSSRQALVAESDSGEVNGTLYASEVIFGAPAGEGPPPPGFDPSTVGRLTRIQHGRITQAQVTMPTGLEYFHGRLYASSWSIASFLGIQHAGQLVVVKPGAFH